MRHGLHAIAIATLIALGGCENHPFHDLPPETGPLVEGKALWNMLAGNTVTSDPDLVPPLVVYFAVDGEMRGMHSNHYRDVGTWKVEGNQLCGNWENWWGTLNRCWEIYRSGKRLTLLRPDDGREAAGFLVPGNVKNL